MFSRFVAALGDQFILFAVPLVILKFTGSVKWSALAFAIEWAPRLAFLPVVGHIADRVNVTRLYIYSDAVRAAAVLIAGGLLWFHPQSAFIAVSLMMAGLSLLQSLVFIGMEATLPRQLPVSEIPRAQSLLQSCDQISQVLGPALAGLAVGFLEIQWVMTGGALFFILSALNSLGLPKLAAPATKAAESLMKTVIESYACGIRVVRENPILLQLMALTWTINVLYGGVLVLSPAIVTQSFGLHERYYGILQTMGAVLSLISLAIAPGMAKRFGLPLLGGVSIIFSLLGVGLAAASGNYMIFALGAVLAMGLAGLFNVYVRSLRAQIIPKEHFGKVTGLIILVNNSSLPVGGVLVSWLANSHANQDILMFMGWIALGAFALVLTLGKLKFRYPGLVPSI